MAPTMNLVNATAGKRLAAGVLDAAPPVLASLVFTGAAADSLFGASGASGAGPVGAALALLAFQLAYAVAVLAWEAKTGNSPGNLALGLRTADEDGFAPGWGRSFVRRFILWLSGIVPVAGPVVVLVSNLWDANHQRQGWHDKAAHTLVVDVRQGRNPVTTGGLYGPAVFAPGPEAAGQGGFGGQTAAPAPAAPAAEWPALAPAGDAPISTVPGAARAAVPAPAPATPSAPADPAPAVPQHGAGPEAAAGPQATPSAPADPDAEHGRTQLRPAAPAPAAARLVFDDGQVLDLGGTALIGRNPAAREGERVDALFNYADMGRSVSKTHLHVAADPSGVWVTDRNSTNGSAVTPAGGARAELAPGRAQRAGFGDTVHFGDRFFRIERR